MKKLFFLITSLVILFCFTLRSQSVVYFAPGFGITNSKVSFESSSSSGSSDKDLSFDLDLPIGFFIGDHFILGIETAYSYDVSKEFVAEEETSKTSYSTVKLGPFFRYVTKMTERTKFFLHINSLVGFGNVKHEDFENGNNFEQKTFVINPSVSPGVALSLSEKIMLEFMLGKLYYENHSTKPKDNPNEVKLTVSEFGFLLNYLRFGIAFWF